VGLASVASVGWVGTSLQPTDPQKWWVGRSRTKLRYRSTHPTFVAWDLCITMRHIIMTTVTFNISEDVKNAFNEMFWDKNQNAVISNLMLQAIENEKTKRQRVQAIGIISIAP
jgi:hypothetical protein